MIIDSWCPTFVLIDYEADIVLEEAFTEEEMLDLSAPYMTNPEYSSTVLVIYEKKAVLS